MKTLDETIAYERKKAEENYKRVKSKSFMQIIHNNHSKYLKAALEHEQRAKWLEELKCYKNNNDFSEYADRLHQIAFHSGYNKAIDDFAKNLLEYLCVENATKYGNENAEQQRNSYDTLMKYEIADAIEDVLERLKAGESE